MSSDAALLVEAWKFAQFDDANLAAVPTPVREALHRHLEELEANLAWALEYNATQIWASIQRHNGDPRWQYMLGETEVCT